MQQNDRQIAATMGDSRRLLWVKRILAGSFLFFLLKGLAWLGVAAIAAWQVF